MFSKNVGFLLFDRGAGKYLEDDFSSRARASLFNEIHFKVCPVSEVIIIFHIRADDLAVKMGRHPAC